MAHWISMAHKNQSVKNYPFDSLPIRPQPFDCEALSSYLLRICRSNMISLVEFQSLVSNIQPYSTCVFLHPDFFQHDWTGFSQLLALSTNTILSLTIYWMAIKLGLFSNDPYSTTDIYSDDQAIANALTRYFDNQLAGVVRYCPKCLEINEYYQLHWRFLCLAGCPTHGIYLRDKCWNCLKPFGLLDSTIGYFTCSACGADMRLSKQNFMEKKDYSLSELRYNDLTYLLSPQSGVGYIRTTKTFQQLLVKTGTESILDYLEFSDEIDPYRVTAELFYHDLVKIYSPSHNLLITSGKLRNLADYMAKGSQ